MKKIQTLLLTLLLCLSLTSCHVNNQVNVSTDASARSDKGSEETNKSAETEASGKPESSTEQGSEKKDPGKESESQSEPETEPGTEPTEETESSSEPGTEPTEETENSIEPGTEADTTEAEKEYRLIEREDWNPDVKKALNDFLLNYGERNTNYSKNSYAVFDFDNTCSIFDVEGMLLIYQIENLAFKMAPEDMERILIKGLKKTTTDLTAYGLCEGTEADLIKDIANAYVRLRSEYGPYDGTLLNKAQKEELAENPYYKEFSAKMVKMYNLVYAIEDAEEAYPWVLKNFAGMTAKEVYALAESCFKEYRQTETERVTWESPEDISSLTGQVSIEVTYGLGVPENINEVFSVMQNNGIDIWIVSASHTEVVKAAVDVFGLHDSVTGLVAMTMKEDSKGRIIPEYDYNGCAQLPKKGSEWEKDIFDTLAQPQKEGKVTSIINAIGPHYDGAGPIAAFMDSTGDFFFCTEFSSLKLVVCINRGDRSVRDGGGLIAVMAMYQKNKTGADLMTVNNKGDTLYLLQGRDENGGRTFRASSKTIMFGTDKETLFSGEESIRVLNYIEKNKMSVKAAIDFFALKKQPPENGLTFGTGITDEYSGYHSIK